VCRVQSAAEGLTVKGTTREQTGAGLGVPPAALAALRDALERRVDELAEEATQVIFAEVPAYSDADAILRDDVRAHVLSHLRASVHSFGEGRAVTREDLLFIRAHAARRVKRIPVADFVHAFHIGERVLWEAALALARDDASRRAALALATHLPRYFEVATTHAAEVYLEAEQQLAAAGEHIRRDLLEDLLGGRPVPAGPRLDAARAAGLEAGSRCLVISAAPTAAPDDEHVLRGGAASLARATGSAVQPLTVVRRDEIVVVMAVRDGTARRLEAGLVDAQRRLADGGLPLAVGVSTVVTGLDQIPHAYREAESARSALRSSPGVMALAGMSAFDYLTLREDPTARRLIAPGIQQFVAEDAQDGGVLITTLREYVASDLNARRAAQRLHIHVNTAYYRLGKVAERTGCDLRRVADLIEILIAARLQGIEEPIG
jgi:hypothetical protein